MADALVVNMKSGDTAPLPAVTLIDADGSPVNLTGCTVRFNLKKGSTLIADHLPVIVDDVLGGVVHFDNWSAVDQVLFLAMAGDHDCEYEVTFPNGQTRTFPNAGPDGSAKKPNVILRVAEQVA